MVESRRLQRVGSRSFAVTLPKQWVTANNLKEHDLVFMERTKNDELLVKTGEKRSEREEEMTISVKEIKLLREFIVLCYVNNVKHLLLTGSPSYEQVSEVKQILRYLEGYEITAQDEKSIEIGFLFSTVEVTVPVLLKRMTYLLKLMFEALEQGDANGLEEFETSLDRLYHLSKRLFSACLSDQSLRKTNSVDSTEQLFFLRGITKRLENIGDRIFSMREKPPTKEDLALLKEIIFLVEDTLSERRPLEELKREILSLRKREVVVNACQAVQRSIELYTDILENKISIYYDKKFFE
jgi:phosphate uptake regulator